MQTSQVANAPPRRRIVPFVLIGFGVLVVFGLCMFVAGAASAGYWFYTQGGAGGARGSSAPAPTASAADIEALPAGNPDAGRQVFEGEGGCEACHSLSPNERRIGPSLSGMADRAAARAETSGPGVSAELYVYESIVNPDAHVVESYPAGVMPPNFRQRLSDQELADLIAYLMTQ